MDTLLKAIGGIVIAATTVFVMLLLTTLIGAVSGWAVGLFFGPTILYTLHHWVGLPADVSMWSLGATLGFVGGFFKSVSTTTKSS